MQDLERDLRELEKNEKKIKKHLKSKNYSKKLLSKITDKLDKYNPQVKLLDNIKYVGHQILRVKINADKFENKFYSRNKIQKIGNDLSKYLQKKGGNGKIMTSIKYPDIGWRSGYFTDIGEDTRLYTYGDSDIVADEPNDYQSFVFYISLAPKREGGLDDGNNDCLFNCLKLVLFDKLPWKQPWDFKKFLKLKRNEKVSIDLIPKIEERLKTFAINIKGDYIYSSTVQSNKQINLLLVNEHYTIDNTVDNCKTLKSKISYNEKIPVLYDKFTFEIYDGISTKQISKEERNDILYNYKSKYILFDRDEKNTKENKSMKEEFDELIKTIDALKSASNGFINMRKTGNYKNTALDLFDRFTKYLMNPEPIEQDEAYWIQSANIGAIIWADKYTGEGYKYDIKSMYPSIMSSTGKFPIKKGEFKILETLDNLPYFSFGIYRCEVSKSEDESINKLFRFNHQNYYTHTSLEHAKALGLNITLIQDSQPNCLFYSREKLIGFNEVFTQYVEYMFNLKQQNIPASKKILNMLWGALSELKRKKYFSDGKEINIDSNDDIILLRPYNDDEEIDIIHTVSRTQYFSTPFARLSPFLLSRGRANISNIIKPHISNIKRVHTDGFISDIKLDIKTGENLGDLVYEGYCDNCNILHCNNPAGEFKI